MELKNFEINSLLKLGYPVDKENFNTLYDVDTYFHQLMDLIQHAKKRILINALYFENDEAGKIVANAIIQNLLNNPELKIHIFVDQNRAKRSRYGEEQQISNAEWYKEIFIPINKEIEEKYQLKDAIQIYAPYVRSKELIGVYHIKGFVIDDIIFYTAASINNTYLGITTSRRDKYYVIKDKSLADNFANFSIEHFSKLPAENMLSLEEVDVKNKQIAIKEFRRTSKLKNYLLNTKAQEDKQTSDVDDKLILLPLVSFNNKSILSNCIYSILENAKKEVVIFTPYFNFTRKLEKTFVKLMKNKVKITIITGAKEASDFYEDPANENFHTLNALPFIYEINLRKFLKKYDAYLNDTLFVYQWKDGDNSYHAKGITIDDDILLCTGHNLNTRGFRLDFENAILCYDKNNLLKEQKELDLSSCLKHSTLVESYKEIQKYKYYPEKVLKVLKKYKIIMLNKIVNFLL